MEKKRLRKGTARVEFFAVEEEVERLLAAGYNFVLAYEALVEAGKITMSYRTFYGHVREKNQHSNGKELPASSPPANDSPASDLDDSYKPNPNQRTGSFWQTSTRSE